MNTLRMTRCILAGVVAVMFVGCKPDDLVDGALRIARAPVLSPLEAVPEVTQNGATLSFRARIVNRGIDDGAGPFQVYMQVARREGGPSESLGVGIGNTITVPATVTIPGFANSASTGGFGGTYVTSEIVVGIPRYEHATYRIGIVVDPNETYYAGVNKGMNYYNIDLTDPH